MKSDRLFNLPPVIEINGEPSRTRTCDPLVKSQLLYRLSYRPIYVQEGILPNVSMIVQAADFKNKRGLITQPGTER